MMLKRKPGAAGKRATAKKTPGASSQRLVLLASLGQIAAAHASGQVRRKNLNVDQGLLDEARALLGVKTETEAVELGLGAVVELAAFRREMLAGFDDLMRVGGLGRVDDEESDFSGFFVPPVSKAR